MRNTLFTRKAAASLMAAVMLLGAVGCGRAEVDAPAAALKEALSALSEAPTETPPEAPSAVPKAPMQLAPVGTSASASLALLRRQALQENEYAAFAAAYLGQGTLAEIRANAIGSETVMGYDFIQEIDKAHYIDVSEGEGNAELYCVFPIDPNVGMVVSIVNPDTDEVQEEVYRAETGGPILLCCNGGAGNAKVSFAYGDGQTEDFWPMTDTYYGEKYLVCPNGGTCYDFTIHTDWKDERTAYLPAGSWRAEAEVPSLASQRIVLLLYLFPQDGTANLLLNDMRSGDYMVGYSGSWALTDDGLMALNLTCNENCTGMAEYDAPIRGNYSIMLGEDDSLTLTPSGQDSPSLDGSHTGEPLTFYQEVTGTHPGQYGYGCCAAALNWYEARYSYRPDYAKVEREAQGEPLICLYDDMGSHILDCGRYTMNPDTLQGCDYNTGEVIDFSAYTDGVM